MSLQPQDAGCRGWIDSCPPPPLCFIAATMDFAMMPPAQWHCEFVTHLAAKRSRLSEAQMVGVRRPPAADQARLLGNKPDMVAVANSPCLGEGENGFIDCTDWFGAPTPALPRRGTWFGRPGRLCCSAEASARTGALAYPPSGFGGVVQKLPIRVRRGPHLGHPEKRFRSGPPEHRQFALERLLDLVGVGGTQPILGAHVAVGPECCVV